MEQFASQDPCIYSLYFDLNIRFRARKVTGTFEKRAPGDRCTFQKIQYSFMTTVSRRCSVLQTVKPVLSGQLMGKSKQLKFHKIKIKPITFDLYLPTFRANSPKELTRSVFTVFFKKRSGVISFKTYQRLEISWPGVNASQMTRPNSLFFSRNRT